MNRGGDQSEVDGNKEESNKDQLGKSQLRINPEILEDFGPWMLAQQRSRRNNRRFGSKNINDVREDTAPKSSHGRSTISNKETIKEGVGKSNRFGILTEKEGDGSSANDEGFLNVQSRRARHKILI